jgi:hypothetical protein
MKNEIMEQEENMNIPIITELQEARVDREACLVQGVILCAGLSENGTYYPEEVVMGSAGVFRGVQCYTDHPSHGESERSVRDVVGVIEDAWADEGRLRATIRLSRAHDWLLTMIGEDLVGDLSINALGKTRVSRRDGRVVREVLEITKAHSVDFVARAAAGGKVEKILRESNGYLEGLKLLEQLQLKELREARPDLFERMKDEVRDELLRENEEGISEIQALEEELERRRIALKREVKARSMIDASGLPASTRQYLMTEALTLQVGSEDRYADAVRELIERQRNHLAELASDGLIRGMGSVKEPSRQNECEQRKTINLMKTGRK